MTSFSKFAVLFITSSFAISFAQAQTTSEPMMRLSTAALLPPSTAVGTSPAAQVIQIYNLGGGSLSPVIISSASWLQGAVGAAAACKSPLTGSCLPLTVTYNTSALTAGTYTAFLSVSDPNAVDSPQTISATVTLIGYGASSGIQLYAAPNGGTATTSINTHGPVSAQASVATGGNWLTVAASGNGSFSFYYPYQITATTQPSQGAGTYTGSVQFSGSNTASDNAIIPVTLNVTTSPIAQLSPASVSLFAGTGGQSSTTVNVANAGQGALTISSATAAVATGSGWLTATVSGSAVTILANAASLQPGAYQGSVALSTNAANNSALTIPVSLLVTSQSGPSIGFGGIVDNTGQAPIAPGDIAVAYGTQFTTGTPAPATALPLSTILGGIQVLVNNVAAPLYYTSSGQIDFQLPYETAPGTAIVQVVNGATLGNKVSVQVGAQAPKVLLEGGLGSFPIIVDYTSGKQLQSGLAGSPGDTLVIYAIGLGQTSPAAVDGAAAPGSPLDNVPGPITVLLSGSNPFAPMTTVIPSFVGLAPTFAGLYQINVTIPATYAPPVGNVVSLSLDVNGFSSAPVQFTVQ